MGKATDVHPGNTRPASHRKPWSVPCFSVPCFSDVRAMHVAVEDSRLVVDLMDGRTIAVPLAWYPRLANATVQQRNHWELAGEGMAFTGPISMKT
ncbi:hypothetical protein MASR1M59_13410 [Melaminivora sp.]